MYTMPENNQEVEWHLFRFTYTYTYMQITVHLPDFAGDKNVDFEFPDDCLFGHPFYFGYHDFIS